MTDHERIWLEPAPGSDEDYGRQWMHQNVWGGAATEYVRVDGNAAGREARVVPYEPTDEMIQVGVSEDLSDNVYRDVKAVYQAMVDAASWGNEIRPMPIEPLIPHLGELQADPNTLHGPIYAIRDRETLVEFVNAAELEQTRGDWDEPQHFYFRPVDVAEAHAWVKAGKEHETGLFVDDDGVVQYADPE